MFKAIQSLEWKISNLKGIASMMQYQTHSAQLMLMLEIVLTLLQSRATLSQWHYGELQQWQWVTRYFRISRCFSRLVSQTSILWEDVKQQKIWNSGFSSLVKRQVLDWWLTFVQHQWNELFSFIHSASGRMSLRWEWSAALLTSSAL